MAPAPDDMTEDDPISLPDGGTIDETGPPDEPAPPAKGKVKAGDVIARKVATADARQQAQSVAEAANADLARKVVADDAEDASVAAVVKQAVDGVLIRKPDGSIDGLYLAAANSKGYNITHPVDADFEVDDPDAG